MRRIVEVAGELGLGEAEIDPYGAYKAKITSAALRRLQGAPVGRLAVVTAITPTQAGEGKTTVSIGLAQGLRRRGVKVTVCLREPSMGPVMGLKGGGTGGGRSEVVPAEEINLHFTGDLHAVTAANNLLAAAVDNSMHHGNPLGIDPRRIAFQRCLDVNDRALRQIVIGLGGPLNGVPREDGFDITAASEVMAVFAVAADLTDLQQRLGNIIVGYTREREPVHCRDLRLDGAMTVLLKQALQPNLAQTSEGGPALIHAGPFANIALGSNSIIATKAALALSELVVTETGFGSDLGAEKFFNVVTRLGGFRPDVAVIVATARALKLHGGRDARDLAIEDSAAVEAGLTNLAAHLGIVRRHGVTPVVAVNRFPHDTATEVEVILRYCRAQGVAAAVADPVTGGGEGCLDLAEAVQQACAGSAPPFRPLYDLEEPLTTKIERVAREVYGAGSVRYAKAAEQTLRQAARRGWDGWPICVAKTQYSLSDDPTVPGRPQGHELYVRELRPSAGAGFMVVLAGEMVTMPGLPTEPAATRMRVEGESG